MTSRSALAAALLPALALSCASAPTADGAALQVDVLAWNIWHGGREDGERIGAAKTIEVIQRSDADLVAMQETYGSGERIAGALGFTFVPRGTNVSIHSRFPVLADASVFEEFKCVGAVVELPDGSPLAFYSIWLPYGDEIRAAGTREERSREKTLAACRPSADDLAAMLPRIGRRLEELGVADAPVIVAGDFNSMSHLDHVEAAKDRHDGWVIPWPTSRVITDAGFVDAYRAVPPRVDRRADRTWTPRFREQEQDRIDFVYGRGEGLRPTAARVIDWHPDGFPSDHAAVLVRYAVGD